MALCCYPFSIFPVTKQLHCFLKFYMIKIKSGFKVYSISPFKKLPTDTCERYKWSFPFYETGTYKTCIPPRHFHAGGFYISLFEHRIFLCQPNRSERLQRPDGKHPELCARYQCGRLLPLSAAVSVFSRSSAQRCVFHTHNVGNRLLCNPWQSCSARSSDCRRNASFSGSRHPRQRSALAFSL